MRQAVVIRAALLDAPTLELRSYLKAYFGSDVYIALDCYADLALDREIDDNVIRIGRRFLDQHGLRYFRRVGWQCGDYVYYAGLPFVDSFSHVWLIEPDVRITLPPSEVFEQCATIPDDLIGATLGERRDNWGWYKSIEGFYGGHKVYGMYFPISRLSLEAIRLLMRKRADYCASDRMEGLDFKSSALIRLFANDEAFVATTVRAHGLKSRTLQSVLGNAMRGYFSTEVPVLKEELDHPEMRGKVVHPVCDVERARKKIAIMRSKYPESAVLATRENEIRQRLGDAMCRAVFDDPAPG